MSYRVTLQSDVKPERIQTLFSFLEANLPVVRSFKGCMSVSVLLNETTGQLLFEEEWISIDCHKQYLVFIESNGVLQDLAEFLKAPPVIRYYQKKDL